MPVQDVTIDSQTLPSRLHAISNSDVPLELKVTHASEEWVKILKAAEKLEDLV
jgi:hypothetical protein